MKLPRRNFLHLAAGAAALPTAPRFAWAQAFPTRPVRLIVTVAAGGGADIIARLIGQWLSERLGQQFVIENRPGGGGNIRHRGRRARAYRRIHAPPMRSYERDQTRRSTTSSISISSATLRRSPALLSCPTSWWCIRQFRLRRSPSSSLMPMLIQAKLTLRQAPLEARPIWRASYSR